MGSIAMTYEGRWGIRSARQCAHWRGNDRNVGAATCRPQICNDKNHKAPGWNEPGVSINNRNP